MAGNVKPIPDGFHTVTPYLIVKGAQQAIDYYKKAFGAEVHSVSKMPGTDTIMNAQLRIGDSMVMLNEEFPDWKCLSPKSLGGSPVNIHLYVEDTDAAFKRAIDAGGSAMHEVMNTFWGDRYGKLKDPFGHEWSIGTKIENLTPAEIEERAKQMFSGQQGCPSEQ